MARIDRIEVDAAIRAAAAACVDPCCARSMGLPRPGGQAAGQQAAVLAPLARTSCACAPATELSIVL
jgi:hypothetical protein